MQVQQAIFVPLGSPASSQSFKSAQPHEVKVELTGGDLCGRLRVGACAVVFGILHISPLSLSWCTAITLVSNR
jgi:hypothetical protein